MIIKSTANDKDLLKGALICIQVLLQHFSRHNKEDLQTNLLLQDAIRYRMVLLGQIISLISTDLKNRHRKFDWFISCFVADEGISVAWSLFKPIKVKFGSKNGFIILYEQLEEIYNQEFEPHITKLPKIIEDKTDYFGIKTVSSIRTVKK